MIKYKAIILLFFVAGFLSSCTSNQGVTSIPTPTTGKATASGRIVSINTGKPYQDATVRLAEIYRNEQGDGAYALDTATSPIAITDKNGYFIFSDIEPREYVLVIGDPMTRYVIISSESGEVNVFNCLPDKITELGEFKIDYD